MKFKLECWGLENLQDYLGSLTEKKIKRVVNLPWVVISEYPGGDVIEFSSSNRAEAMGFVLEHLLQESYSTWEDAVTNQFGVSDTILIQSILKYILTPDERHLLSRFYYGGLIEAEKPERVIKHCCPRDDCQSQNLDVLEGTGPERISYGCVDCGCVFDILIQQGPYCRTDD